MAQPPQTILKVDLLPATAATSTAAGTGGLIPAPQAGDQANALLGNMTYGPAGGAPGPAGIAGPAGFGEQGSDGEPGMAIPGPQGIPGPASIGPQGMPGIGVDGADGDSVFVIQPGQTGVSSPPAGVLDIPTLAAAVQQLIPVMSGQDGLDGAESFLVPMLGVTGDVAIPSGTARATIQPLAVKTGMYAANSLTYDKIQQVSTGGLLLGSDPTSIDPTAVIEISPDGASISYNGSNQLTVSARAITAAQLFAVSSPRMLGRISAGSGDVEQLEMSFCSKAPAGSITIPDNCSMVVADSLSIASGKTLTIGSGATLQVV